MVPLLVTYILEQQTMNSISRVKTIKKFHVYNILLQVWLIFPFKLMHFQ